MRWVRANLRLAAWCALFAIAVQLVLSFGHFHNGLGSGSISTALIFSSVVSDPAGGQGGPPNPGAPPGDYCGICAVINLAGSVVAPDAPTLLQPAAFISTIVWRIVETSATPSPHLDARARAPPSA
jgi:hypothetical protein